MSLTVWVCACSPPPHLSPHTHTHTPMFVSMYSRPTSAPSLFPKLTRKHPNILASASQIYSPAAVWVGEAKGRGWGRRKSQRVAGTAEDKVGSDQGWSHARGRRAVMGSGTCLEQRLSDTSRGKNPPCMPGIPRAWKGGGPEHGARPPT